MDSWYRVAHSPLDQRPWAAYWPCTSLHTLWSPAGPAPWLFYELAIFDPLDVSSQPIGRQGMFVDALHARLGVTVTGAAGSVHR